VSPYFSANTYRGGRGDRDEQKIIWLERGRGGGQKCTPEEF